MHSITFNGHSCSDFGLVTVDAGRRQRAEEQIDEFEIPYRNGDLIIHSGKYKPYLREMEFAVMDKTKINLINAGLVGRGILTTSLDQGGFFIASVISGLSYQQFLNNIDTFKVGFKVNPFFYLDSGKTIVNITSTPKTLVNLGTKYSEPLIKITGSGDITLTINTQVVVFTGVIGYISIDTELMACYKDTLNTGDKMTGLFPVLVTGINTISYTGTVTKIEITPRWREL